MSKPHTQAKPVRMLLTYHKGLSRFFRRVFPTPMHGSPGQMTKIREYIRSGKSKHLLAIHNPRLNPSLEIFAPCQIVHIMRHPKDFIVSGYHYHRRGSEAWLHEPCGWLLIQSAVTVLANYLSEEDIAYFETCPSYHDMLHHLDFETGMMLEVVWRKHRERFFPLVYYRHSKVTTFRFEDIVLDPPAVVAEICQLYAMSEEETQAAVQRAEYETKDPGPHVRNKAAYQYRKEFTPKITSFYDTQYPSLAEHLGYPP